MAKLRLWYIVKVSRNLSKTGIALDADSPILPSASMVYQNKTSLEEVEFKTLTNDGTASKEPIVPSSYTAIHRT